MYDDDGRKGYLIRNFLIKLILIIIFVALLVWFLPKPNLKGLNNRIFNENVAEMKDAAISYFTTDRLPQKEGESVTLTLQEMLDMKLLLPFKDKDGNSCDTQASYVTLTKKANEYELKVNLKCKGQEDYIIVHLGCYSYCKQAICEAKEEPKQTVPTKTTPTSTNPKPSNPTPVLTGPSCTLEVTEGKKGDNGWYLGDITVSFKTKKATASGAKLTAFGIGTSTNYDGKSSFKVTNDGVTKVYGYVKDSNGKTAVCSVTVKKDTKKPNCSLSVLSGTKNNDGNYITNVKIGFADRSDATSGVEKFGVINSSKETYNNKTSYTVTALGKTKVYGYIKDYAGNKSVCSLEVNKVKVEEDKISNPSCNLEVKSGTLGDNGWYRSNVVVGFKSKGTTNGATVTGYGIGLTQNYDKNDKYTLTSDGTKTIYGYVKDSKGNTAVCSITVKKDNTKPSCELAVQSGTYSNGYYTSDVVVGYKDKKDVTSGMNSYGIGKSTTYSNNATYKITTEGDHTLYGYVKDNAGNTNVCSINVKRKNPVYEYEYLKTWDDQYSDWSDWTTATYDPSNPPKFGTTATKITEDLGSKKVSDGYTYKVGAAIYGTVTVETASISEKVCSGYKYYRSSTTATKVYAISEATDWQYLKTITLDYVPESSLSVLYEFAGYNWTTCTNACSSTPYMLFKVYTRTVSQVSSTGDSIITSSGVRVACGSYETKTSYVFGTRTKVIGYEQTREEKFKTVYSYRYKTRTLIQEAGSSTKWSRTQNDSALLSQGYKMTGKKRLVG